MEENGKEKGADCSKDKGTCKETHQYEKPRNFLHDLMYREYGIGATNKASTKDLAAIAETKLILKDHKELKCNLPGVPRATFLMVFSPDGTKVASAHGNHFIYVTDVKTGKNIKTLSGHPRTPWCIAFHPWSNDILASGCLGGQVRVWDLSGGSEVWTAQSETGIASLAFHPSERLLVIATYNEIHFWDWREPSPFAVAATRSSREKVRYVAFDKSGQKLITGIGNTPNMFQSQWDIGPREVNATSQNRNSENISRTARSPIPQTGSVTIEVRRNRHAAPYETEANDVNRQVDEALPSVQLSPVEIDTSSEGEPPPLEPVSDTESSEVELRRSAGVSSRVSTEATIDTRMSTQAQNSIAHLERPEPIIRPPKPAAVWPRRINENQASPASVTPRLSLITRTNHSIVDILAAVWARSRPTFLRPLSNSISQSGASTSVSLATMAASTSSTSSGASTVTESHEQRYEDTTVDKLPCGEAAEHTGRRKPTCIATHQNPSSNRSDDRRGWREITSAMAEVRTSSAISNDHAGPNGGSERNNKRDASTMERKEIPCRGCSRDDSNDDAETDRSTDDGDTSSSSDEAQASSQREVPQRNRNESSDSQRLPSTSGFTVSSRSAFQLSRSQPNSIITDYAQSVNTRPGNNWAQSIAGENAGDENNKTYESRDAARRRLRPWLLRRLMNLAADDGSENNNNVSSGNNNNNTEEENGEESGYWLLEENSNSDSNHENVNEEPGSSTSSRSRNLTSRWIPVESTQTNIRSGDSTSENSPGQSERGTRGVCETSTSDVDRITDRNQLSPVIVNSTRIEQQPLFRFASLRENRANKRDEENRETSPVRSSPEEVPTNESRAAMSSTSDVDRITDHNQLLFDIARSIERFMPGRLVWLRRLRELRDEENRGTSPVLSSPEEAPTNESIPDIPHIPDITVYQNIFAQMRKEEAPSVSQGHESETTNSQNSSSHLDEPEEPAGSTATGSSVGDSANSNTDRFHSSSPHVRRTSPLIRLMMAHRETSLLGDVGHMWQKLYHHIYSLRFGPEMNEENRPSAASMPLNPVRPSTELTSNRNSANMGPLPLTPLAKRKWPEFQNVVRGMMSNHGRERTSDEENQPSTSTAGPSVIPNDVPSTSSDTRPKIQKLKKLWFEEQNLMRSLRTALKPDGAINRRTDSPNTLENSVSPIDNEQASTSRSSISNDRLDPLEEPMENDSRASSSNRRKDNPDDSSDRENSSAPPAKRPMLETSDDSREEETGSRETPTAQCSTNESERLIASQSQVNPPRTTCMEEGLPIATDWLTKLISEAPDAVLNSILKSREAIFDLLGDVDDSLSDAENNADTSNGRGRPVINDEMASGSQQNLFDSENHPNASDQRASTDNSYHSDVPRQQGTIEHPVESDNNEASSSHSSKRRAQCPSHWLNTTFNSLQLFVSQYKESGPSYRPRVNAYADNVRYNRLIEIPRMNGRYILTKTVQHLALFFKENQPRNGSNSNIPYLQILDIMRILRLVRLLMFLLLKQWFVTIKQLLPRYSFNIPELPRESSYLDNTRVQTREMTGINVPDASVNNVPVNFSNLTRGSPNYRFRSCAHIMPQIPPVTSDWRQRNDSRLRETANLDNTRGQTRERTGLNVPAVCINNVPVNFSNVPRRSPNYRFRSRARIMPEIPPVTIGFRTRNDLPLPTMLLTEGERHSRLLYERATIRRTLLRAAQVTNNSYVGARRGSAGSGSGGQDPDYDSDDITSRDYPNVLCEGITKYRVQAWDFSRADIPDLSKPERNVVVQACQIHNDASIDISADGKLLVTVIPPRVFCFPTIVGVFSLQWETLGRRLHSVKIHEPVVSVSLSPTREHLLVGLSVRRTLNVSKFEPIAVIYKLVDQSYHYKNTFFSKTMKRPAPGENPYERAGRHSMTFNIRMTLQRMYDDAPNRQDQGEEDDEMDWFRVPAQGFCRDMGNHRNSKDGIGLLMLRELVVNDYNRADYILNCIRWAPEPGQGMVYATNTGQLNILH